MLCVSYRQPRFHSAANRLSAVKKYDKILYIIHKDIDEMNSPGSRDSVGKDEDDEFSEPPKGTRPIAFHQSGWKSSGGGDGHG